MKLISSFSLLSAVEVLTASNFVIAVVRFYAAVFLRPSVSLKNLFRSPSIAR